AFVSRDGHTTFGVVYPRLAAGADAGAAIGRTLPRVERALSVTTIAGSRFHVTGIDALDNGSGNSGGHGVFFETMLAGLTALVVLAFVFGSFLAIIPLLMAVVAIPTTFLLVWGLTRITEVSFLITFLIALIGLGVAIDYSLLVVMRWREERANGLHNQAAISGRWRQRDVRCSTVAPPLQSACWRSSPCPCPSCAALAWVEC
ncbi:MAG TPA: MMPL family transporter, partial [Chloroflexota bacterium]|nr:MMPL family transporter [Chloroflexota bacterium]